MRERILAGCMLISRKNFERNHCWKFTEICERKQRRPKRENSRLLEHEGHLSTGILFILFWALLKKLYAFKKKTRVLQAFVVETLKARHKVCTCAGVWPNAVCRSYPLLDFIEEENHLVGKNTNILNHLLGSSSGGIVFNCPYQFACRDPWK